MLGISMSNIYVLIIMSCQFCAGILIYIIANKYTLHYGLIQVIYQFASFSVPILIYKSLTRRKFSSFIPLAKLSKKNLIYIIIISFGVQPCIMLISSITSLFFTNSTQEFMANVSHDYPFAASVLILAVIPAFFEEISMRGVISQCLENVSFPTAAVLSGFYFALIHLNPQQFAYAFILGIILWILYNCTKSMLAPMIAHFIINFTQVLLVNFNIIGKLLGLTGENNIFKSLLIIMTFIVFSTIIFFKAFGDFIKSNPIPQINNEKIPVIKILSPSFIALIGVYIIFTLGFVD